MRRFGAIASLTTSLIGVLRGWFPVKCHLIITHKGGWYQTERRSVSGINQIKLKLILILSLTGY